MPAIPSHSLLVLWNVIVEVEVAGLNVSAPVVGEATGEEAAGGANDG